MAIWHGEKGRKSTGGKINLNRGKRKFELGNLPLHTKLGARKIKIVRTKGGGKKIKAFSVEFVNVIGKENKKVKILDVLEHPDNTQLARRGIITKGCIVKTELGSVKITSRPSQHGIANGVALEKEK